MADGAHSKTPVRRGPAAGLTYPFAEIPGDERVVEVAPGVLWLRFSLPFVLNHVNVWAIEDGAGWAIVDTGVRNAASQAAWETILVGPLGGRPITRVICTHMHPDHIGLAGWLCERFDAPLLMTRLEYVTARMLMADTGRPAPEAGARFYRAMGWTEGQIETYRAEFGRFGRGVAPLPDSYQRLTNDDLLSIGGQTWRIVVGSGHSPEHACLLRESDGVLIAGDQVLPTISSNISVWPTEPDADPLADWLESLARFRQSLSDDLLVLPSHGEPFYGLHLRIAALERGHGVALTRLQRSLRTPRRAVDVFASLFGRPVGEDVLAMATGESVAHLNYLTHQGLARCDIDASGVAWWVATGSTEIAE